MDVWFSRGGMYFFGRAVPPKLPGLNMMPFKIASLKQTKPNLAQFAWLETPEKPCFF